MPTEILMPALSPTMEEGTLAKWLVKEGDTVASGDILAEIETDKATMEFEAVDEGVIGKILVEEGTEGVKVNAPIAVLLEEGESAGDIGKGAAPAEASEPRQRPCPAAPAAAAAATLAAPQAADGSRIFASPLARRIAATRASTLPGSRAPARMPDRQGRCRSATTAPAAASAPPRPNPQPLPLPPPRCPPAPCRRCSGCTKAARSKRSRSTACARRRRPPHRGQADHPAFLPAREIRSTRDGLPAQLNKQLEGRGVKLSVNDFIIKACANALQTVPDANAVWRVTGSSS